jgi:UTP--glucose-1-phosphate uridylyltransferase
MKPSVTKAVIPAAGLGTRFLPATKAQPKEMLPVVDKPAIQYVVEEAVQAGIDDIPSSPAAASGRWKTTSTATSSWSTTSRQGKSRLAEIRALAEMADIHCAPGRAARPRRAVSVARKHVGDNRSSCCWATTWTAARPCSPA